MGLTDAGRVLYEHGKQIFKKLEDVNGLIAEMHDEPSGELFVVCGPHFGTEYLLPHLPHFLERYPKIRLKLSFRQSMPDLINESVDVVCGLSMQGPPDSIQKCLRKSRNVLCATKAYLTKFGKPKEPLDLLNHRLITHALRSPNNEIVFKSGQTLIIDPYLIVDDTRLMLECALLNVGFIRVHHYVVEQALAKGDLVEVLPKFMEQKNTIPIYICYLKERFIHPKTRLFVDFILNVVKNHENS